MEAILKANLDDVRWRMAAACGRAGRTPEDALLVAVTKTVGPEAVQALARLGVTDIGENRVQDALRKHEALGGPLGLHWHMIGHLQTNKVRHALPVFERIHSVDSLHLAAEISRRAEPAKRTVPILIEVKTSGEESKFGVAPTEVALLLDGIRTLQGVRAEGLMTMAPIVDDAEEARPFFAALRELRDRLRAASGLALPHLSMGMTQDFEVAIEEGATLVRVGSALFRGL